MPIRAKPKPPLSRAYTLKASKIPDYFEVLLGNPIPEVFDTAFLAKSGFRYAIDRAFIDILTGLGFLTEAGRPTRRYADFHGRRLSGTVLRQGVAEAYAGLLAALPNVAACPEHEIMEIVSRYFQGEINDMAAGGIAATFLALTRYAAGLDNGSAIADSAIAGAAQRPVGVAVAASEQVSSALGASGPAAAVSAPAAATQPVAAGSPAVVATPESAAQAEAVPLQTASGIMGPTGAFAPTHAQATANPVAPKPEPVAPTVAEAAALAVAPMAAASAVPAAATAMPAVPEAAVIERTPAMPPETPPQATPAPVEGSTEAVPSEAAAGATPPASLVEATPAPSPVPEAAPTHEATAPEPGATMSPETTQDATTPEASPAADTATADETDEAPSIVIEAASPEGRSPGQGSPKHPTIHITLPTSTDEAVYDAIFASLKRHLLSPGDNA